MSPHNTRTLEQRLTYDHGLIIGRNLVRLTRGDQAVIALVEIGNRGAVSIITKPKDYDRDSSAWYRVKGDTLDANGCAVIVWRARDPSIRAMFDGEPVASIEV